MPHKMEIIEKGIALVSPGKELESGDRAVVQQLRDLCQAQVEEGLDLIVDFSNVNICPSLVWGNLLVLSKRALANKRRVAICCLKNALEKTARIVGLSKYMDIFTEKDEALRAMQQEAGNE